MFLALAIGLPAAFAAGVIFHKYVISEANAIKAHVSNEINELKKAIAAHV